MHEPTRPAEQSEPLQAGPLPFPDIPGYRFHKRLGQGGMATVYLATQESLDRPVSIKVMARDALQDETSKQRFENEARTIAKLAHSGIVGIHEVGRTSAGQMYYIMPYLPNGDLSQRDLREDETRIVEILHTLLSALGYAHAHGIVHRDVKGENVLFDAHQRPLLTDFGIALSKRDTSRLTTAGLSVGSSGYMAPEQARGEQVDGRADLYSVGVLAYALLTGHLPFRATDALALALMHAQDPVPRLPPDKRRWQGFIDRAMAKSPAARFASAEQMRQALDDIGRDRDGTLAGRAQQIFTRMAGAGSRGKRMRPLLLAGLLLAIGLYAAYGWFAAPGSSRATAAPQPALAAAPAKSALPSSVPPLASTAVAPPVDAKPAVEPAPAPVQQPAKPAPAKPVAKRQQPVKKKRSWFSRIFRRH